MMLEPLYAGEPDRSKDSIPFLTEVLVFSSFTRDVRLEIHFELRGDDRGRSTGELLATYVASGTLQYSDVLAVRSPDELKAIAHMNQ